MQVCQYIQNFDAWSGFNVSKVLTQTSLTRHTVEGTIVVRTLTLYLQCERDGGIRLDGFLNSRFQF
jgi:hypothetical protein